LPLLARHVAAAAAETIARLEAIPGESVDLLSSMQMLALEIAARSMFSLEMPAFGAAIRRLIGEFAVRLGRPYFFDLLLPPAIPTPHDIARMMFRRRWVALMDEVLDARLATHNDGKPRDLFDILLAARDPQTGRAFSRDELRDQIATLIVAGHETTALTLFWSLYLLACAPAEQEWMAAEVRALDISPDSAGELAAKLPRTRAVVDEALRLYPPAFMIVRKARARDQIDDLVIPPGGLVMVSPFVLHRHVRLWEEPDRFIPQRFVANEAGAHRFAYLPFGAGPRVCIGAQFALMEASLVLAMLIARFEIAMAQSRPVLPVAVVTTQPDHPALFRLTARR
jgi:cytochrome P450